MKSFYEVVRFHVEFRILNDEALNNTIVSSLEDKIIYYKDLKVGQNIRIIEVYDLIKEAYVRHLISVVD